MTAKSDPLLSALKAASRGLLFPSETDAPLEPFAWPAGPALSAARVLELSGSPPGTAIEQTTLADLWRTIPSEERARFQALQHALESALSGIAVYTVGDEAEKAVYIVGKATDGRWAGVKTVVVET